MVESKIFLRMWTMTVAAIFFAAALPVCGQWGSIATLGYALSLYLLQKTYQRAELTGKVFYSFLMLGLVSTICMQALVFVPFMWLVMLAQFGSMTMRNFSASLLGLLLPYWVLTPICMLTGNMDALLVHLTSMVTDIQMPDYSEVGIYGITLYFGSLLLLFVCSLYYYYTDTSENPRQKAIVTAFMWISVIDGAATAAQPQFLPHLTGMMLMAESMIVATTIQKLKLRLKSTD